MKHFFLAATLLALGACSKDNDAKSTCCTDANFKVVSSRANLHIIPPNVITPNGDGRNERFQVIAFDNSSGTPGTQITFAAQTLKVFLPGSSTPVFDSPSYRGEFDGHGNSGAELAEGTYRYELKLDDNVVTGSICIVRQRSACTCRAIDPDDALLDNCQ